MNIKTRKEKMREVLTTIKRIFITTLLVAWGIFTVALGLSLGIERRENRDLRNRIEVMENQNEEKENRSETRYIILDY